MTKFQVGDKVRSTVEGTVAYIEGSTGRLHLDTEHGPRILSVRAAEQAELLERRKPKVGDKVETRKDFAALPVGTVAKRNYTQAVSVRVPGGFTNINDSDEGYTHPVHDNYGSCGFDGTIVYLPD